MFTIQQNSYLFAVYIFNNKPSFYAFKLFSTLLNMALNPAIIHRIHVCITCISVKMQTHITCRWSGSAPFVTSLTRARVWTQLINTKRCQRALESAALSWSCESDVFVFLCLRLILSDPTKKDHQWCADASIPAHPVWHCICPPLHSPSHRKG